MMRLLQRGFLVREGIFFLFAFAGFSLNQILATDATYRLDCQNIDQSIRAVLQNSGQCFHNKFDSGSEQKKSVSKNTTLNQVAKPEKSFQPFFWFYKKVISPQDGNPCQFYPSCSLYSQRQLQQSGLLLGIIKSAERLTRDHPFIKLNNTPYPQQNGHWSDTPAP